mgnify:CR=1 FL=1
MSVSKKRNTRLVLGVGALVLLALAILFWVTDNDVLWFLMGAVVGFAIVGLIAVVQRRRQTDVS